MIEKIAFPKRKQPFFEVANLFGIVLVTLLFSMIEGEVTSLEKFKGSPCLTFENSWQQSGETYISRNHRWDAPYSLKPMKCFFEVI